MDSDLFFRFGTALFISILIGLQREYAYEEPDREHPGGVRTLALMGLLGCAAAMLADHLESAWPFAAIVLVIGSMYAINYGIEAKKGKAGLTTEGSVLLTFAIGALIYFEYITLAVALGVTTFALLSTKWQLHQFARQLTREDIYATLKFALISAIVLPILPDHPFGPAPFDILNPFKIWLLVVFISGISFVGYILIKIIGAEKGIGLTGLLGGLASSTAVTMSFSQKSRQNETMGRVLAFAIIIAWTVMFARVIIEVTVVNPSLFALLWQPVAAAMGAGLLYVLYLYYSQKAHTEKESIEFSNPFELGPAIKFGLIFTLVLVISKAAQIYMGESGIYLSSFLAGLADVDAIALSMAQLDLKSAGISDTLAAQAIVLAAVANTFAKGAIVLLTGSRTLRMTILPGYILMMAVGITVAFWI